MSLSYPRLGGARVVLLLDALLAAWTTVWIVLAILIAHDVHTLSHLSGTVVKAGRAVELTGQTLGKVADVPFVGGQIKDAAQTVEQAGRSAEISGRESRSSVSELAWLLGIAIAVIPIAPLLGLYAPLRIARVREVRSVRRALRTADASFDEYLARRAVENLPYHRLRAISENPWRDLEQGRHAALAEAELERLGIRVTRTRA